MKKVYVFLADGFEEIEGITVIDILRRASLDVCTVSIKEERLVHGGHGIDIMADQLFTECDYTDATMLILPGGMEGMLNLKKYAPLEELLVRAYQEEKYIAAICAAPSILGHLGMLQGRNATSYPSMTQELIGAKISEESVVQDGHVITSRGVGTTLAFSLKLVEVLQDVESRQKLAESILYKM